MLVGKRVVGSSPPSDVGKGVRCDLSDQEAEKEERKEECKELVTVLERV